MATSTTSVRRFALSYRFWSMPAGVTLLAACMIACSKGSQPGSGPQKKLQVSVGEIKEVRLNPSADGTSELIGTSDNQEVVEVSRQQLAPAVDTLKRGASGPTVFQIKGITVGTANVMFAKKQLGDAGPGTAVRTYVVRVTAK